MPHITVEDPSRVAEARRNGRELAIQVGFDEQTAEKVAIVVTEIATNVLKHGGGGQVLVHAIDGGEPRWRYASRETLIEVVALDSGPGIENLERSLKDGYSTRGTSGTGLGAIARLSSHWEVYSIPGSGTALLARIGQDHGNASRVGVLSRAKPGEDVCGDDWGVTTDDGRRTFLVADGLGHGPGAAAAAKAAVQAMDANPNVTPAEMIEVVHGALRHTRGAAVAVAAIDEEREIVLFAGLGNISASLFAPGEPARHMVSMNGTAGMEARHVREYTYPFPAGGALIMHSDGVGTRWSLSDYPGLVMRDPALIAGVLLRDHARRTDDAIVLVAK